MTLAEVLPALQAGRRVRRAVWREGACSQRDKGEVFLTSDLLASDWELADEPDPSIPRCGGCLDLRATITRLTRELERERDDLAGLRSTADRLTQELDTERRACGELGASNLRLIRELAETKTELAAAKARRCGEPLPGALQVIRCDLSVGHSGQHHMPGVGSGVSWST